MELFIQTKIKEGNIMIIIQGLILTALGIGIGYCIG